MPCPENRYLRISFLLGVRLRIVGQFILVALIGFPSVQADWFEDLPVNLPELPTWVGAGAVEGKIVVAGGWAADWQYRSILVFDPETMTVSEFPAKLPIARIRSAAASDGHDLYLFGGSTYLGENTLPITKVEVEAGTVEDLAAEIPSERSSSAAVMAPGRAYVFGGVNEAGQILDEILRFDLATHEVTTLDARLPVPLSASAAALAGEAAFLLGGKTPGSAASDRIFRFNLASETVEELPVGLPSARHDSAAFSDGRFIYLFAGTIQGDTQEAIRFDSRTGEIRKLPVYPEVREGASGVWLGDRGYLVGGGAWNHSLSSYVPGNHVPDLALKSPWPGWGSDLFAWEEAIFSVDAYDVHGTITRQRWDFGDGTIDEMPGNASFVRHVYTRPGIWNVTVTVWDDENTAVTRSVLAEVVNRVPHAEFDVEPFYPVANQEARLASRATDWDREALDVVWRIDGAIIDAEGENATFRFAREGTYNVTQTVRDAAGAEDIAWTLVNVSPDYSLPQQEDASRNAATGTWATALVALGLVALLAARGRQ